MLKPGLIAATVAGLAIAGFCATEAFAQAATAAAPPTPAVRPDGTPYKTIPPIDSLFKDKIKQSKFWSQIKTMLANPQQAPAEGNKILFEAYYKQFYFPLLTLTDQEHLEAIPKERERFFRDHLEYCKFDGTHAMLVDLTLNTLLPIVRDEGFHPAVRYNAMLIIGGLNAQEAVRIGGNKVIPVPYLPAFSVLLAEFKNPKSNDAIRVAALLGIARHLEWDNARDADQGSQIPPPIRADVVAELLKLATTKESPPGRTPEGHEWLRRRAVEALALAGAKKGDAAITDAIDKILADDSDTLLVRCAAAKAIDKLNFAPPLKLEPADATKKLGYLALVACDYELNRLAALRKLDEQRYGQANPQGIDGAGMPGGGMQLPGAQRYRAFPGEGSADSGYGGIGMTDPSLLDPKAYRRDPFCRRVRAHLYNVQVGLQGVAKAVTGSPPPAGGAAPPPAGTPADKKYLDDVKKAVEELVKIVEIPEVELATVEKDLRRTMQPLEAMTKKLGVTAKPAAADDVPSDLPTATAKPAAAGAAPAATTGAAAPAAADLPAGDLPAGDAPAKPAPAKAAPATPMPAAPATPMPAAAATPAPAAPMPAATPDPLAPAGAK